MVAEAAGVTRGDITSRVPQSDYIQLLDLQIKPGPLPILIKHSSLVQTTLHHHLPPRPYHTVTMSDENGAQKPQDGHDPNLVGPEDTHTLKMTGAGEPGSHSAVFGLTPDGKKHDETTGTTTAPKAAHTKESAVGGGSTPSDSESSTVSSSNQARGGGVADQMNDPQVAEKGHGGRAVESEAGAGDKAGSGLGGAPQGSGDVQAGEGGAPADGEGLMAKAKGMVGGGSS